MFRGRIVGLLCFATLTLGVSGAMAQSTRSSNSGGSSLVDRLTSLRQKFLKEEKTKEKSSRSGNASQRRSVPEVGPRKSRSNQSSRSRNTANTTKSSRTSPRTAQAPKRSGLPRVQVSDLFPGSIFGRDSEPVEEVLEIETVPRRRSSPRAGSAVNSGRKVSRGSTAGKSRPARTARRSPPSKRNNETALALADLRKARKKSTTITPTPASESTAESLPRFLQNTPEADQQQTPAPNSKPPTRQKTRTKRKSTEKASLDLRGALLGKDLEDLIAEDAADALNIVDTPPQPVPTVTRPEPVEIAIPEIRKKQSASMQNAFSEEFSGSIVPPTRPTPAPLRRNSSPSENQLREAPAKTETIDEDAMRAFSNASSQAAEQVTTDSGNTKNRASSNLSNQDVLLSYREPVIVSRVKGPRKILVGHEANYEVTLQNTSRQIAKQLNATVRIPAWVDLVDVMSSRGVVQRMSEDGSENILQWKIHELDPDAAETLRLRLIPRSGQALQLGIRWSQAAVGSETVVEVQEPKLHMTIGGPDQVLFGKPQRYRLSLSNPGTGVADDVVIHLVPPGGDPNAALQHDVGSLTPGEAKEIELELTAKEAGELMMKATAMAKGGLQFEVVKQVLCRKPELQLDWRGPESKYAGTVATYFFRIRNPGTAKTDSLSVDLQLPEGAKFISASDGHSFDSHRSLVSWNVIGLSPEEERFLQIRCHIDQAGVNRLKVTARTESGGLSASKTIETEVVALADLKLSVSDPRGPVAVGEPAEYVIRVRNHGTTSAEDVNIVALFSEGIDPTSVEGAQYTIRDGRVTFRPIKSLPAGGEVVLRIRAEAAQAGNHIFRTEVFCSDLDIKLSAEESTRFFVDNYHWEDGETPYSAERSETTSR